jgi:hypothetical protein
MPNINILSSTFFLKQCIFTEEINDLFLGISLRLVTASFEKHFAHHIIENPCQKYWDQLGI